MAVTEYPSGVATDSLQAIGSVVDMPDAIRLRAITTFFNAPTVTLAVEGASGFGMRINIEDPNALGSPHLRVQTGGSDVFEVNGYGSIQLGDGTSDSGLSDAGTAKLRYNGTALQVSLNGGAYADVSTGSGGGGLLVDAGVGDNNLGTTSLGTFASIQATADDNIGIGGAPFGGSAALASITTGDRNVAIGSGAGKDVTGGVNNSFYGYNAGGAFTSGDGNIAIGYRSADGIGTYTFDSSTVIGTAAGLFGLNARSTVLGAYSQAFQDGDVAIGFAANDDESGNVTNANVALGARTNTEFATNALVAGYNARTGGARNTVLGDNAGRTTSTGDENILLGSGVANGTDVDGDNNILIGADLELSSSTDSFRLRVSPNPTHVATPLIDGVDTIATNLRTLTFNASIFCTQAVSFSGKEDVAGVSDNDQVAIGVDTFIAKLDTTSVVAIDLRGIDGGSNFGGRVVILYNDSSVVMNLLDASGPVGSHQFRTPNTATYSLNPRDSAICWYDADISKWLVIGKS